MGPSFEDILALPEENEVRRALVNSGVIDDYDPFCERVEAALIEGATLMENMKSYFDTQGEDQLTATLVYGLKMKGFDADHDTYRNGHCDLLVKGGRYEWYGEAKLDNGPNYILEGFRQLCDRYASANPTSSRGCLIVYTSKPNKLKLLNNWIKRIKEKFEPKVEFQDVCKMTLTARSSHEHPATGITFKVRHIPISLFTDPTDKSARAKKGK